MIQNVNTYSSWKYISVYWNRPTFLPKNYELSYSCKLKHDVIDYISRKSILIDSREITHKVRNLLPDSFCTLTLLAVYNSASVDRGITTSGETSMSGKYTYLYMSALTVNKKRCGTNSFMLNTRSQNTIARPAPARWNWGGRTIN